MGRRKCQPLMAAVNLLPVKLGKMTYFVPCFALQTCFLGFLFFKRLVPFGNLSLNSLQKSGNEKHITRCGMGRLDSLPPLSFLPSPLSTKTQIFG